MQIIFLSLGVGWYMQQVIYKHLSHFWISKNPTVVIGLILTKVKQREASQIEQNHTKSLVILIKGSA